VTGKPAPVLRVYVAGPYTADPEECTAAAIRAGGELLDAGCAPFVPHLAHYWETLHQARPYEDWMRIDLAWLTAADALLRLPGSSSGADRETARAEAHGIPVFGSVAELLAARDAILPADRSVAHQPPPCAECHGTGAVPDYTTWNALHQQPRAMRCPACTQCTATGLLEGRLARCEGKPGHYDGARKPGSQEYGLQPGGWHYDTTMPDGMRVLWSDAAEGATPHGEVLRPALPGPTPADAHTE
jgi:hypothetical protein